MGVLEPSSKCHYWDNSARKQILKDTFESTWHWFQGGVRCLTQLWWKNALLMKPKWLREFWSWGRSFPHSYEPLCWPLTFTRNQVCGHMYLIHWCLNSAQASNRTNGWFLSDTVFTSFSPHCQSDFRISRSPPLKDIVPSSLLASAERPCCLRHWSEGCHCSQKD